MVRKATLAPHEMSDRALWRALDTRLRILRPGHLGYEHAQAEQFHLEALEILLELKLRGTQFSLLPPAAD